MNLTGSRSRYYGSQYTKMFMIVEYISETMKEVVRLFLPRARGYPHGNLSQNGVVMPGPRDLTVSVHRPAYFIA